ncbi:hypothetical protein VN97_g3581 [Penicillium thymicola]|uniref:Uncharacterized protein n=1 Tax=Penicillium thymicola TaxID=293382 RepID=A0AAI9XAB3_PENTH|nr:hypothetical protein VN97_g3581 [Penicillium thymicola]
MLEELDMVSFGHLPFDLYVMEYPDGDDLSPEEIPPYVPQDLMSDEHRATDGQSATVLWIRTWYGRKNDPTSQSAANAGYNRLRSIVHDNDIDAGLDENNFFENEDEFGSDSFTLPKGETEFIDGVACGTPGSVPSYMITALMRKPDTLDGLSRRDWAEELYKNHPDPDMMQCLMVVVADRKACEEGWVLFLAVNHKGDVLPFRIRENADRATLLIFSYMEGQSLDENTRDPKKDMEYYMREGDGWAC